MLCLKIIERVFAILHRAGVQFERELPRSQYRELILEKVREDKYNLLIALEIIVLFLTKPLNLLSENKKQFN